MRPLVWSSVNHFRLHLKQLIHLSLWNSFQPQLINMQKLIIFACLIAAAYAGGIGIGLGLPAAGYGYIGGLTKLPNLGFGNVASVNSNQNTIGYQLHNLERGPLSIRSHVQSAITPLGVGIPVGVGFLG